MTSKQQFVSFIIFIGLSAAILAVAAWVALWHPYPAPPPPLPTSTFECENLTLKYRDEAGYHYECTVPVKAL